MEQRQVATTCCSLVGIGGSAMCSFAMVAAAAGLFATAGATAVHSSSMAGMASASSPDAGHLPAWLEALVRYGPQLLVASLAVLAVGVGLRRPAVLTPAAVGGAILYVGMYKQHSLPWMYAAIAVGTVLLLIAYLSSLRSSVGPTRRGRQPIQHPPADKAAP
jgi:hypothetical protein